MPSFTIKVKRTTEYEAVVEADDLLAAIEMAVLEAKQNGEVVDEQVEIRKFQSAI